jgi:hypothetical protein
MRMSRGMGSTVDLLAFVARWTRSEKNMEGITPIRIDAVITCYTPLETVFGCYADTYKQCYGACQVVAGDKWEIGQHDAKRSHVVSSTTGDGVPAPQSGATHFQGRRNRNG